MRRSKHWLMILPAALLVAAAACTNDTLDDGDGPDVFERVEQFVAAACSFDVQITVMTPFPGTPLYERLEKEGRLLHAGDWARCTLFDVNFRPKLMSVEALESGLRWLFSEVYNETELKRRQRHYMDIVKQRRQTEPAAVAEFA